MNYRYTALLLVLVMGFCAALFVGMEPDLEPEAPGDVAAVESAQTPRTRPTPDAPPAKADGARDDADERWPEADPPPEVPDAMPAGAEVPSGSVWPLSKDGIDGSIREVLPDIRDCYQDALSDVPDLEGGFKVHFVVEDEDGLGQVVEVGIRDMKSEVVPELMDGPMEDCVLDVFETLQFDPPEGGRTSISYPFSFSAG